jgi:hypothetical protein
MSAKKNKKSQTAIWVNQAKRSEVRGQVGKKTLADF